MAQWLRNKLSGRKEETYDPRQDQFAQQLVASLGPTDANSDAARKELEINIHTIEDEGLIRKLDSFCVLPGCEAQPIKMSDGKGGYIETTIPASKGRIVPWALAARVAVTKVLATRFISKRDAIIYKNRMRNDFLKIKRDMSREDRRQFIPFLNAVEMYCLTSIDDAIDGQKMLSLKTSGKHLQVGVHTGNEFGGK